MKKIVCLLLALLSLSSLAIAQSPIFTKQANMNPNRLYADSGLVIPVINSNRTFATNRDSIGQLWFRPDSVKLFGRFPGNLIKSLATEDTTRALRTAINLGAGNYIQNQSALVQTGSYNIDGSAIIGTTLLLGTTTPITNTLLNINKAFTNPNSNVVGLRAVPQAFDNTAVHTGGLVGGIFQPIITGSNTQNWSVGAVQGVSISPTINTGAAGIISNVYASTVTKIFNSATATVDTLVYRRTYPSTETTPSTVNNTIFDLIGLANGIGGNWSRYDATALRSYWGTGNQLFNTTTDNGFGEKIQVNGRININRGTRGTNAVNKDQLDSLATTTGLNTVLTNSNTGAHAINLTSGTLDIADGLNLFNGSEDIVLQKRASSAAVSEVRLASDGSIRLSPSPSATNVVTIASGNSAFTGNVTATGNGIFARNLLYQPNSAGFNKYEMLGFTAADTAGLWEWGISGPASGAPTHGGGPLVLRSHLTTGAVSNDVLSIPRLSTGIMQVRSNMTVGTAAPVIVGSATMTVLGTANINGTTRINGDIRYNGAFYESSDIVVTADYDASSSNVQYIYVNATGNITITLPVPTTSPFSKGRVIHIKKIIDNAATITLICNAGTVNVEFGSSFVFATYKQSITLRDDGTQWFIH